jgi:hypothetical protein
MKVLEAWAVILRDEYGVIPRFVHTDKDMAEIGMSRRVWMAAKHQLCWWHQREAVRKRLKGDLPTSVYNLQRATSEHPFIDPNFKPHGRADPKDSEGSVPGEIHELETQNEASVASLTSNDPNSIKIRVPALTNSIVEDSGLAPLAKNDPQTLKIRIPALSTIREAAAAGHVNNESNEESTNERHTFCLVDLRLDVINMMEHHFCAHPLIPGYSAPTPEGIKAWAVKQIYQFCEEHNLPNLWAYLWENWYRRGRWELWARCGNPAEIPRLKTTMIVESQ